MSGPEILHEWEGPSGHSELRVVSECLNPKVTAPTIEVRWDTTEDQPWHYMGTYPGVADELARLARRVQKLEAALENLADNLPVTTEEADKLTPMEARWLADVAGRRARGALEDEPEEDKS